MRKAEANARAEYLTAHLGYLEAELKKYEGKKNREGETQRLKERIKGAKRELKDLK